MLTQLLSFPLVERRKDPVEKQTVGSALLDLTEKRHAIKVLYSRPLDEPSVTMHISKNGRNLVVYKHPTKFRLYFKYEHKYEDTGELSKVLGEERAYPYIHGGYRSGTFELEGELLI